MLNEISDHSELQFNDRDQAWTTKASLVKNTPTFFTQKHILHNNSLENLPSCSNIRNRRYYQQ